MVTVFAIGVVVVVAAVVILVLCLRGLCPVSLPPHLLLWSSLPCIIIVVAVVLRGFRRVVGQLATGGMCGQREGAVAVSVVLLQSEVKWEKKGSHTAESCEPVGLRVGEDLEGHGRAFCLN
jgi:hypothetical protein